MRFNLSVILILLCGLNWACSNAEAGSSSETMTITATVVDPNKLTYGFLDISTVEISSSSFIEGDTGPWFDRGRIMQITLNSTVSKCVDIKFFTSKTHLSTDVVYHAIQIDGNTKPWHSSIGTIYQDADETELLHWKIFNCGSVETEVSFNVYGIIEEW